MVESNDNDIDNDINNDIDNDNKIDNDNDIDNTNINRTLIVGVCNSGKTYLMMNKTLLGECDNPDRQIKTLTRSLNQYPDYGTSDEILSIDEYKDCTVVFDEMLENKQKKYFTTFQSR